MQIPLPQPGQRFSYGLYMGGQWDYATGQVVQAWHDELGDVVVNVLFDNGCQSTFWNSSFMGWHLGPNETLTLD